MSSSSPKASDGVLRPSLKAIQWLGGAARRFPAIRPVAAACSRMRAALRGGGLILVDNAAIVDRVLTDLGRPARTKQNDYAAELLNDAPLRETFEREARTRKLNKYASWESRVTQLVGNIALYYALVRELRPNLIVETGTATGSMTSFLLAALHRNQNGRLISIDLPAVAGKLSMDIDVPESEVGYWIPRQYRDRWEYRKGDAKLLLPRVMTEERVDFFVHDSLHSRSHMAFEYAVARALMPENTVIMSDDIFWNDAFDSFAALHRLSAYVPLGNPSIGVVVNRFEAAERALGIGVADAQD